MTIILYGASVVISFTLYSIFIEAYEGKLKRLGYIHKNKMKSKAENIITSLKIMLGFFVLCGIPLVNLASIYFILDFDRVTNKFIKEDVINGTIEKVDEIENNNPVVKQEYLIERIKEVKDFQKELGYRNKVISLSDYTTDEKIAFYLRELELLYEEKAKSEGIDLTEKIDFCQEDESIKKLSLIDHNEPYK